jgi:GNAT superfamily N-acetyltransferase
MAGFRLHRPVEEEWAALRDLRIRSVADAPYAFLETLDEVLALDEEAWRARVRRGAHAEARQVVAEDDAGRWIGSAVVFVSEGIPEYVLGRRGDGRRANLVGVFVDPDRRGAGVLDALLEDLIAWVRDEKGIDALYLHVSEHNPRARRAYDKRGFLPTGMVDATAEQPGVAEIEMVLPLAG